MRNTICLVVAFAAALSVSAEERVLITQFDLSDNAAECGEVRVGAKHDGSVMCVDDKGIYGGHLQNLGMHANSSLTVDLGEGALRLEVDCAVDDRGLDGNVQFQVLLDGKVAADSGIVRRKQGKKHFAVDLRGAKKLTFKVLDGGDGINGDHGDWFNLFFFYEDGKFPPGDVRSVSPRQLGILTPKPGPEPRINGAAVFGVRPCNPVVYRLPVTGERPMELAAKNLPEGLRFDPATQVLSGSVAVRGDYEIVFTAKNAKGVAERALTLKVGDAICLTPALGWNSWNAFGNKVTASNVIAAAEALVSSGLADHGWTLPLATRMET